MDTSNIIFNMPFDESNNSAIAYDYSASRADGQVHGAQFVSGKNGNAIKFTGNDTCVVEKSVLPLDSDFTMLMWVKSDIAESAQKLTWQLTFGTNKIEIPIDVKPNVWVSLAVTRQGSVFNFYVNSSLIQMVDNTGTLLGILLNQDSESEYGIGQLDDVKFYNIALTQEEIITEIAKGMKKQVMYLVDGIDFKDYGVFVSDSKGVVNRPRLKEPAAISWDNYHGEDIDLNHKFYEPREITLSCFVKASGKSDFISKVSQFGQLFDKKGTQRLTIDVHPTKPLVYEVYCKDEIDVSKTWNDELMVGTFNLKLIEPEPVKRILKHIRASEASKTCSITLTSIKRLNIYWGDGKVDFDVSGDDVVITHDYENNGDYYVIITGCIDEIAAFDTNAIVVYKKI